MTSGFEADLDPETGAPRVRFNFANGWSASVVLGMPDKRATRFGLASVACAPTGRWGAGQTELLNNEAFPDEVAAMLFDLSNRPAPAQIGGAA